MSQDTASSNNRAAPPKAYLDRHWASELEKFLNEKGFTRKVHGSEVVYVREHHRCPGVRVKVWTSIDSKTGVPRPLGRDAIRVSAAYEGKLLIECGWGKAKRTSFGIYKAKRISRRGEMEKILDRLYRRMWDAYSFSNSWLRDHWRELGLDQIQEEQGSK